MTAMNEYLAEARMSELRESQLHGRRLIVSNLMVEATRMLKGALTPVCGPGATLGRGLQKDLGLR